MRSLSGLEFRCVLLMAIMDEKVYKVTENTIAILTTEVKLEFCPKYFEEPCISQRFGHDEYDVVASALRLSTQQRKIVAERLRKGDSNIYVDIYIYIYIYIPYFLM